MRVAEAQIATLEGVKAEVSGLDGAQRQLLAVTAEVEKLEKEAKEKNAELNRQVEELQNKAQVLEDMEAEHSNPLRFLCCFTVFRKNARRRKVCSQSE